MILSNLKKSDGFTLIETALVLSLISLILSFPIIQFKQLKVESETQLFFESLGASLTLAHSYAILNQDWPLIIIKPDSREISFQVESSQPNHPLNHKLYLPDSITMPEGSVTFRFSSNTGNQSNLVKIPFDTAKGRVILQFKFGKGRFTIDYT